MYKRYQVSGLVQRVVYLTGIHCFVSAPPKLASFVSGSDNTLINTLTIFSFLPLLVFPCNAKTSPAFVACYHQ